MVQVIGDPEVIHRGMMREIMDDLEAGDIGLGMDELRQAAAKRDRALIALYEARQAVLGSPFPAGGGRLYPDEERYITTADAALATYHTIDEDWPHYPNLPDRPTPATT